MILLLTVLLAVFVVPSPWGAVLVVLGLLAEAGEIAWGLHLAKGRPKTGAEAMIGRSLSSRMRQSVVEFSEQPPGWSVC